jgi:hypothetical protein
MHGNSKNLIRMRMSSTLRGLLFAVAGATVAATAAAAVTPVETSLGVTVKALIDPMPAYATDTQVKLGHDTSTLTLQSFASGASGINSVDSNAQATLSFTGTDAGTLITSWRGNVYGPQNNSIGNSEQYALATVPGSIYNANPNAGSTAATYAFTVGGSGSVEFDWSFATSDSRNGAALDNIFFGSQSRPVVTPASLEVWHNGSVVDSRDTGLFRQVSNDTVTLPFSALAGDTVVLRLLPRWGLGYSSSIALNGQIMQDFTVNFAITAVPEPQVPLLLSVGLAWIAWRSRRRVIGG